MKYKFNKKIKVKEIAYTLINKKIIEIRIEKIEATITIKDNNSQYVDIRYSLILNDYTSAYLGYCSEKDLYKTKEELINNL